MAKTQVSDIIEPSIFQASVIERTAELSRLVESGIVARDPEFDALASGKGRSFDMPFWQDISGNSEVLSDSASLTPAKIAQSEDIAHKHFRGKAWSANDLAGAMAGDDPMKRIVDLVAAWWARDMQDQILLGTLTGIFATTLSSTHVNDISTEDGDNATSAELIGSDAVIDSVNLLGDSWGKITAIAMHSTPFSRLQKLNLIEFKALAPQGIEIPTFLGREVIVDDNCPTAAGSTSGTKYTSYLFGAGVFAWGEGGSPSIEADESVEVDRDTLAGDDFLVNRRHFIMHPRGIKYTGTPSALSPTKTELEVGASWTKVWETKNVRVLKLVTNG